MMFKQENFLKTLFVFFGFVLTIFLALISRNVFDAYSSVETYVDLTSSNTYTDTTNTSGIWKTNYLGGAHAGRRWGSLGGGSTSTAELMVTSTIWQTGRNGYAQFDIDSSDNIHLTSLDFPSATTYRISASKFGSATKQWSAYSGSDSASILFVTSTAISYNLSLVLDQLGNPAIVYTDTGAASNLYYTKWNSSTNQWEDVSGNASVTTSLVGQDSSYAVGVNGFVPTFDTNNNLVVAYTQASSTFADIKIGKWSGSDFVGLSSATAPDSLAYVGGLAGKALLWPNIRLSQDNKAYLFFVEDVPASSNEKAHIIEFDGSQWINPVTGLTGYYQYINPPAYFSYHGTRSRATALYGSEIYFGFRIWPSSSEARSLYLSKINTSSNSFSALDGTVGTTSTANLIMPASTAVNIIDAIDVLSSGVVGVRFSGSGATNKSSFYQYWDPTALTWRSFVGALDGVAEGDIIPYGRTIANGINSGVTKFDSNGLPVILTRAKDPNDTTHDAIFMARGFYVTSTPSVIQTTDLLTQTGEEFIKATATYSGNLNGGSATIELSADQGETWVSANAAGEYVWSRPSNDVRARILINPESSGYTTPILSSLRVSFIPTGRFASIVEHLPNAPIFESIEILSSSTVKYTFTPGSGDTTGFKIVSCNNLTVATSTSEKDCVNIVDTGLTDQTEARSLIETGLELGRTYCDRKIVGFNQYGFGELSDIPCFSMPKKAEDSDLSQEDVSKTTAPLGSEQAVSSTSEIKTTKGSKEPLLLKGFSVLDSALFVRPLSGPNVNDVFVIVRGKARLISPTIRKALDIPDSHVVRIWKEELSEYAIGPRWTLQEGYPDGTLISFNDGGVGYVIIDRIPQPIDGIYFLFSDLVSERQIINSRKKFDLIMEK
jgi:hypothetical protein